MCSKLQKNCPASIPCLPHVISDEGSRNNQGSLFLITYCAPGVVLKDFACNIADAHSTQGDRYYGSGFQINCRPREVILLPKVTEVKRAW